MSGVLTKPKECQGIAAAACDRCVASGAPYRCLNCTRDARAQHAKPIRYILENGNLQQVGCAACANISSSSGQVDRWVGPARVERSSCPCTGTSSPYLLLAAPARCGAAGRTCMCRTFTMAY